MDTDSAGALQRQARWLEAYRPELRVTEQGRVLRATLSHKGRGEERNAS